MKHSKSKTHSATSNPFKNAVESTPEINKGYQVGLKALGNYSNKVQLGDTSKCNGSVDIDACTQAIYPQDNRWDYVFGYNDKAYFVEVHGAYTGEVSVVLKKLEWLKDWLIHKAPELNKLKAKEQVFVWVQSNGNHILKNSPQNRRLAQNGLTPVASLIVK
ncbi:hypothetical protein [Flectobacillus rivi]|uniref:Uncharacterized protein n=1 Tax=Flectobacillus rivi TaxID=2984209 RepID=A0ABT6Z769_9BACT|nr:hypothetical protein [Flectobacillus rivi]MDI9876431.1 hypothetical protein [Flectobacillus rivi]